MRSNLDLIWDHEENVRHTQTHPHDSLSAVSHCVSHKHTHKQQSYRLHNIETVDSVVLHVRTVICVSVTLDTHTEHWMPCSLIVYTQSYWYKGALCWGQPLLSRVSLFKWSYRCVSQQCTAIVTARLSAFCQHQLVYTHWEKWAKGDIVVMAVCHSKSSDCLTQIVAVSCHDESRLWTFTLM